MSTPDYIPESSITGLGRMGAGATGFVLHVVHWISDVNWYRPLTLILLMVIAGMLWEDRRTTELEVRDANGVVRLRAGIFETEAGQHPAIRMYADDGRTVIVDLSGRDHRSALSLHRPGGQKVTLRSTYETSSLVFRDQAGTERLQAGMTANAARVQIADRQQQPTVVLAEYPNLGAGLLLGDQSGVTRAGFLVGDRGPLVLLRDEEERPRLTVDLSPRGSAARVTEFTADGIGSDVLTARGTGGPLSDSHPTM